jgi:hypothetical protein
MMATLHLLLLVFAFVLLLCQAFNVSLPRVSFGWLGLALWVLDILLAGVR